MFEDDSVHTRSRKFQIIYMKGQVDRSVTEWKDMGVSKDGVHLSWVACWVVEKLLGLVTAMAGGREDIARDLEEVTGNGKGELVTAVGEEEDITRLDTATDVVVEVMVEVQEVATG